MTDISEDWELVKAHLPEGWEELGREMRLIRERPKQLGAKIDDLGVVLRLVFHQVAASASLRSTTALAAATQVVTIAAVSLHKWMKKLGPYLAKLLTRAVETASFEPEKWGGLDVIAGDATTVQRPGSKGTTARVHYALRLADMTARHIEVTDEHGGEKARRFRAEPGEVWLLDRVYANPDAVAAFREREAHLIVRLNRTSLPLYDKAGRRIDVMALLGETVVPGKVRQVRAVVHAGDARIVGRLCWLRLPADKAQQARRRAKQEHDGPCGEETLFAAEFVMVFTTVLNELTAAQVLELYRARWQVELEFKRDKSIRELDRLPNFLPETIYSWICAKLLLQLISVRIANGLTSASNSFPPGGVHFEFLPVGNRTAGRRRRTADRRRALVRRAPGVERPQGRAPAGRAA